MAEATQKQMPVAIQDCHQLLAWMIPQLDHFPEEAAVVAA